MTTPRRFESDLPALLADLYLAGTPEYRDDLVQRIERTPQRPAWIFPERWLPVELVTQRVPVARMPWRQLGVLALIALLVGILLAFYAGTQRPHLPAPFGPADNGLIAMTRNGDLYTVDPRTGEDRLLLGGPENDEWVDFTPDGTRGLFVRWGPEGDPLSAGRIGTIRIDGKSGPVFIDKNVIHDTGAIFVAPNGRDVAFTTFDYSSPVLRIVIASLDGNHYDMLQKVDITDYGGLSYLAPDGRELVYLARSSNSHTHDIWALDVTTGETRSILLTSLGGDIVGNVSAAPDGKHLAYALQASTGSVEVHVIGTDGKGDIVVGHAPGATFEAWPQWDPQGRRLLIERDAGDGLVHPVIVDLSGGPDVVIDTTISQNGAGKMWAPDGSAILAQRTADDGRQLQQELWDVRTGKVTQVSWPSVSAPMWQRVAD
jgi:hypothetical protein